VDLELPAEAERADPELPVEPEPRADLDLPAGPERQADPAAETRAAPAAAEVPGELVREGDWPKASRVA
jgi:hypothetical protein